VGIKNWLEQQGVGLSFRVKSARISLEEKIADGRPRSISMRLALEGREDVRLADKRSLKDVRWSIYAIPDYGDSAAATREDVGILSYHEASSGVDHSFEEECHIQAVLSGATFDALFQSLQAGRVPDHVHINARDLKYGWEPDGSGKEWDVAQKSQVLVTEVTFGIPISLEASDEEWDDDPHVTSDDKFPPTKADARALCELTARQNALMQSLKMTVFWFGVAVVALLLFSR